VLEWANGHDMIATGLCCGVSTGAALTAGIHREQSGVVADLLDSGPKEVSPIRSMARKRAGRAAIGQRFVGL
jgi:hypothetical protein